MKELRTRLISLSALALGALACSAEPPPEGEVGRLSGALLDAPEDHEHLYSVGVCGGELNQDPNAGEVGACLVSKRCSGTLIAPNLVLTVRACVDKSQFQPGETVFCNGTFASTPPAVARVTLGDTVLSGASTWLDVAEVRYPGTNRFCDDNIALLVLKDKVPGKTTKPAAVDVGRDVAENPPQAFTLIGRGGVSLHVDPVTFAITADNGGLKRRIAQHVPFACASNDDGGCVALDITSDLPDNLFFLPKTLMSIGRGVALGDGGSAFIEQASFDARKPKVMGVATLVPIDASGDPNLSIGVRTSLHKDFLVEGAHYAAKKGHYPVPEWARDCD